MTEKKKAAAKPAAAKKKTTTRKGAGQKKKVAKKKASAKPEKKERGRPSAYREEYAEQARKLCLLGATDKEMAEFFGVSEQTLNTWKKQHTDFLESIKQGKAQADADVADRLYQRAMGYEHAEDKIFNANGQPLVVPTVKHYPPEPAAAIFWLKNRQKHKWRDKIDHEHTGKDGGPIESHNINTDMSAEEAAKLYKEQLSAV